MERIINKILQTNIKTYYPILEFLKTLKFDSSISPELLYESFEYEKDSEKYNSIQLHKLFSKPFICDIKEIYVIIKPNINPIRNKFVGIGSLIKKENGKCDYDNIGCNPKDVQEAIERLQSIINDYMKIQNDNVLKPIIGFILYLLYERIHPHEDGNGRMGRYLFFENSSLEESLFPLSGLLYESNESSTLFNEIFHFTNFPRKNISDDGKGFNDYPTLDEYFDISFINNSIINRIIRVLYIAKVYKYLKMKFKFPNYIIQKLSSSNKGIKQYSKFNPEIINHITNNGFDMELHRLHLVFINETFVE